MSTFGQSGIMRSNQALFTVRCEKIGKRAWYKVNFPPNNQINERIKLNSKDHYKWSLDDHCWHLHIKALYDLIKSYRKSDKIKFEFGENGRIDFLEQIKKLDQILEEKQDKIEKLKRKNEEALIWKKELEDNHQKYESEVLKFLKPNIKLYPHQIVAAMFLKRVIKGMLLLDMGTGKSLSSIAYCEMMGFKKILVIVPNSLKFSYQQEVIKFSLNSKAFIINSKYNEYPISQCKYIIVNYEYFANKDYKKIEKKINDLNLGMIECSILDECQKIKTGKSVTYKNIKKTINNIPSIVLMSGSPAPNRSSELFNALNIVSSLSFPNRKEFMEYYCGMTYDPNTKGGWIYNEKTMKLEELYHKLQPFSYRKLKSEVLKDLPDIIYQNIYIEMSKEDQDKYDLIEAGIVEEIFNNASNTMNILTIMLRLRQFTSLIKIPSTLEIINSIIDNNEKCVVFDVFKETLINMNKSLKDISGLHTGDQDLDERNRLILDFQNPDGISKVFLASSQTANYGLTLTQSSKLIINQTTWSLGELDQMIARVHRISQKNTVYIYIPQIKNSIDEYVFNAIEKKRTEIMKVIDNQDYESKIKESVLSDVLNTLKEKYKK